MKTIVCLDFDGVIVDSITECLTVSKKAFMSEGFQPEEIDRIFYPYRFLVRPAYQYGFLIEAIEYIIENEEPEQSVVSKFNEIDKSATADKKREHARRFFEAREALRQNEQYWVDLHSLTDFGKSIVGKDLANHCIVTTKDKKSVEILSRAYDLRISDIYSKEDFDRTNSKGEILIGILEHSDYEAVVFVDDSVEHLDSVGDERVKCYFANWGYDARPNDYPVYIFDN